MKDGAELQKRNQLRFLFCIDSYTMFDSLLFNRIS